MGVSVTNDNHASFVDILPLLCPARLTRPEEANRLDERDQCIMAPAMRPSVTKKKRNSWSYPMTTIKRHSGSAEGRCRAVGFGDLVFTVATSSGEGADIAEQTRLTLDALEHNLIDAGSAKTRILSATVYLERIEDKAAMDAEWCSWIGPAENWPQRACVQAQLANGTLVEINVIAAKRT